MLQTQPQFEPVAWWYTRNQIGRQLRERYQAPKELPPRLLTLLAELGAKSATFRPEVEKLIGNVFLALMAAVIALIFYKGVVIF
jgi:hypothetical protein